MSDLACFLLAFAVFTIASTYLEARGLLRRDPAGSGRPKTTPPAPPPRRPPDLRALDGGRAFDEAGASQSAGARR